MKNALTVWIVLLLYSSTNLNSQELHVHPTVIQTDVKLRVQGEDTDVFNFIVENGSADDLFMVSPTGRVGIKHHYNNIGLNVRGTTGDSRIFQVQDPSGTRLFSISPDGRGGLNNAYTNAGFVIKGVSGDGSNFIVENSLGNQTMKIFESGRVGINGGYSNVGFAIKGVAGDASTFLVENDSGDELFKITSSGRAGINKTATNVAFTVQGVPGDALFFQVEDDAGADVITVSGSSGLTQIHQGLAVAGTKMFKIDHPLDPENRYLTHNCMEGPKPYNVYQGMASFDQSGEAIIELPDYFEALNIDYTYQLTCVGGFSNIYVKEEIKNNQFKVAGGKAGMKVSWQVSGVRNDPHARAMAGPEEIEKSELEKGTYLYPQGYGHGLSKSVGSKIDNAAVKQE